MPEETNLEVERSSDQSIGDDDKFGDKQVKGPLLATKLKTEDDEAKIAKRALKLWQSQDEMMKRPEAQWKVNTARRRGVSNAKVLYSSIDDHWTAWFPKNAAPDITPDVNKAATLCRRMTALMYADPPAATTGPPGGDVEDVAANEFAQRVLDDIQGVLGLQSQRKARRAFDRSHNSGSAYEWFWVDQKGGGRQPIEIQARKDALTVEFATMNPATQIEEGPYVTRYAAVDGSLTDDRDEAATKWAPGLKSKILDGRHVRLIPHTCDSIEDADGVQIAQFMPWWKLKVMAPELANQENLEKEKRSKLFEFRPDNSEDLIPGGTDHKTKHEDYHDEALVFTITTYYKSVPEYEKGLYLITLADSRVLHRSDWHDTENNVRLDLPVSQMAGWNEGREGYWDVGLMEIVGGGNEVRAAQIAGLLDHLEKFGNRKTYLPTNSLITPEQISSPRGSVLNINPGGEPKHEPAVDYDQASLDMFGIISKEMDDASGMQETASGTQSENVNSGRQAFAIISQVHAGLSEPRENIETFYIRGSYIVMQLAKAFFDVPRQLKWEGEDGVARHRAWTRSDLTTTTDIRLTAGTLSMLAPAAKAQLAERYVAYGAEVLPLDEFREILAGNVGGMVGLQDNPHRLRIQNQIGEWMEGPPEGWREDQQQEPAFGPQPVIALDDATPENPAPQPRIMDPILAHILEPVPSDEMPQVATLRMSMIGKAMANPKYRGKPEDWRAGLDLEYQHMVLVVQGSQAATAEPGAEATDQPPITEDPAAEAQTDLQEDALQEGAPPELVAAGV